MVVPGGKRPDCGTRGCCTLVPQQLDRRQRRAGGDVCCRRASPACGPAHCRATVPRSSHSAVPAAQATAAAGAMPRRSCTTCCPRASLCLPSTLRRVCLPVVHLSWPHLHRGRRSRQPKAGIAPLLPTLPLIYPPGCPLACCLQGSGLSEGGYVTLGALEVDDLAAAVQYLREEGGRHLQGREGPAAGRPTQPAGAAPL